MLSHLRIGPRLIAGFGVVLALFLVTSLLVGGAFMRLMTGVKQIQQETLPYILVVDGMDASRIEVQQFLTDVSATHNREGYKEADKAAGVFLAGVAKYREMFQREGDKAGLAKIDAIEADFKTFHAVGKTMAEAYVTQGIEAGNAKMTIFDQASAAIADKLGDFRKGQVAEAETITTQAVSDAEFTLGVMVIGGALSFLVAGLVAWTVAQSITRPLLAMQDTVVRIGGSGDLTLRVAATGQDELAEMGKHLNQTLDQVGTSMRSVNNVAGEVAASAEQLSSATAQLTESSHAQAATAADMAAAVEEITTSIGSVADHAVDTESLTEKTAAHVAEGETVVGKAQAEMARNATQVRESARHIEVLSEQSRQVGGIVQVIREIADQTNLLALNAAIEAARAGETGRGFAVVADEVRKLAERTSAATTEIGQLIDNIQRDTTIAVESMAVSSAQADKGASLAKEAGDLFAEIKQASDQAAARVRDITAAAREQNAAGSGISSNVEQVACMSEENSAATASVAETANHLKRQANLLTQAVARFRV